jgi:hypothetical protein
LILTGFKATHVNGMKGVINEDNANLLFVRRGVTW